MQTLILRNSYAQDQRTVVTCESNLTKSKIIHNTISHLELLRVAVFDFIFDFKDHATFHTFIRHKSNY